MITLQGHLKSYNELEAGNTYTCRLSGFQVLIIIVVTKEGQTMSGNYPLESEKQGIYYNPMTGGYNRIKPCDNQLYTEA